jgi:hypothetical protein
MPDRPLTGNTPETPGKTRDFVILAIALAAVVAVVFLLIGTDTLNTTGDVNTTQQPSAQSQAMDERSPATGETKTP